MSKTDIVEIREPGGGKLLINRSKFDPAVHTLWKDDVEKVEIEKQEEIKIETKTVDEVIDEIIEQEEQQEEQEEEQEEEISKPTRRKYTRRN
jgi:hypothetical protein